MQLKSTVLCLAGAALLRGVAASPYILRVAAPKNTKRQVQEITSDLGCSAKGPLAGPWAVELFTCQKNSNYTCQATASTGCDAGDASNIETLMVLDSTTGQPLSGAASIAEAYFRCPENGLVQCSVHFANNGSEAGSYGLRIIDEPEETPFSNVTFGAPTDSASDSSDLGSTDSGFGSPTDSGFGGPTDTDTGFGSSPTDSGFGASSTDDGSGTSPTDDGFGSSPTDSGFGASSTDGGFGSSPTDSGLGGASTGGSDPSSDAFNSEVFGDSTDTSSGSPTGSSSSSGTSTSTGGFGSVPSDDTSGFA